MSTLRIQLAAGEDGRPIRTAQVPGKEPPRVCFAGPGLHGEIPVDDRGVGEGADLPAGSYQLWAVLPDRAVTEHQVQLPDQADPVSVVIAVPRGRTLRGVVADEAGSPLPDVSITCFGTTTLDVRRARSNALGDYELRGLNEQGAVVYEQDGRATQVHPLEWMGSNPEGVLAQDVVLTAGATYYGHALRADGSPAAGVTIQLIKSPEEELPFPLPNTETGEDGSFVLPCCPSGPMMLYLEGQLLRVEGGEGDRVQVNLQLAAE